jgi:hypothetical protein
MTKGKKPVERRKHKRFRVKPGAVAVLTPRWPHSTPVGDILDISTSGLALRYVTDEVRSSIPSELSIVCTNPGFYLRQVPVNAVSDFEMARTTFASMVPRRLGLQFGELMPGQVSQLEYFIQNHTTGEVEQSKLINTQLSKSKDNEKYYKHYDVSDWSRPHQKRPR